MTMDTATNPYAMDVASSATRQEARAKILQRLWREDADEIELKHDIPLASSARLNEVERILTEAENALVQELKAFIPELEEALLKRAKMYSNSPKANLGAQTAIYREVPDTNGIRNRYLLGRVPELQEMIDRIHAEYGDKGIIVEIRLVEKHNREELRIFIDKPRVESE